MEAVTIKLAGVAREIVGTETLEMPASAGVASVGALRKWLGDTYPEYKGLAALAVTINGNYADDAAPIHPGNEIALIPPATGG